MKKWLDDLYGRTNTTRVETIRHALGAPFILIGVFLASLGCLIAGEYN